MTDIFKDYLSAESIEDRKQIIALLRDLEILLADPQSAHERIAYLEALSESGGHSGAADRAGSRSPLTGEELRKCIKKGLIGAVEDRDVRVHQLLQLAHSIEGLRAFADALYEIPEEQHAPCWKGALEAPFEVSTALSREESAQDAKDDQDSDMKQDAGPIRLSWLSVFRLPGKYPGWAVAAAVLIIGWITLIILPRNPTRIPSEQGVSTGWTISSFGLELWPPVYAAEEGQVWVKKPAHAQELAVRRQVMLEDIDNDGDSEILVLCNGFVYCFDHNGDEVWEFELTPESFIPEYEDVISETLSYLSNNSVRYPRFAGLDRNDIEEGLRLLLVGARFLGIHDLDGDSEDEILLSAFGPFLVALKTNGEFDFLLFIEGGDFFTGLKGVYDLNHDGDFEIVSYRESGWPLALEGGDLPLEDIEGEEDDFYVYSNEPYTDRGIYIHNHLGQEIWHLNLPFHVDSLLVDDLDGDGYDEIALNTYTPQNHYLVRYSTEHDRLIAGNRFDWDTFDTETWPYLKDTELKIMILGMDEANRGQVELMQDLPGPSDYSYFQFRVAGTGNQRELIGIWYSDEISNAYGDYFYMPYEINRNNVHPVGQPRTGVYPEMRFHRQFHGVTENNSLKWVYGLSPVGEVVTVSPGFNLIHSWILDEPSFAADWPRTDVLVLDTGDLDSDGSSEILAAFGPLHDYMSNPSENPVERTEIRIFNQDLSPFKTESGLDHVGGGVQGAVMEGRIMDIDGDGRNEVVVIADEIVILSSD
jgi:hypothetical protein